MLNDYVNKFQDWLTYYGYNHYTKKMMIINFLMS